MSIESNTETTRLISLGCAPASLKRSWPLRDQQEITHSSAPMVRIFVIEDRKVLMKGEGKPPPLGGARAIALVAGRSISRCISACRSAICRSAAAVSRLLRRFAAGGDCHLGSVSLLEPQAQGLEDAVPEPGNDGLVKARLGWKGVGHLNELTCRREVVQLACVNRAL